MSFKNSSVYYIPVWFDNLKTFAKSLESTQKWDMIDVEELAAHYLLSYAHSISVSRDAFVSYRLKSELIPNMYRFHDMKDFALPEIPEISEIRFSCFATGVGFIEVWVSYGDLSLDTIIDFSYNFKKAAKADRAVRNDGYVIPDGQISLYSAAKSFIPENSGAEIFFTRRADYKYECLCFHKIKISPDESNFEEKLCRLRRSYNTGFEVSDPNASEYDMIYSPYPHDKWSGSQEGLVNMVCETGNAQTDRFTNGYKFVQLGIDYNFLYLMLLNQRFSAIKYIDDVAKTDMTSQKSLDALNKRIVKLKTAFSFRVISDDLIFQNVYSKMYKILDIDNLLEDIQDNESQMEMLQNAEAVKAEKLVSYMITGLSILSIFSILTDAISYLERFRSSIILPIVTTVLILTPTLFNVIRLWKKHQK